MLLERIRALFHRRRLERDLDDELAFHLAMRAEKEGAAAARRRFGNPARIRESCRALWTFAALETLGQDLRYAVRTLTAAPAFTAVAVLSLALGIGANAALFSVMDVMLLRPLPVRHPEELVEFVRAHPDGAKMTNLPQEVFEFFQRDGGGVLSELLAVSPSGDVFRAGGPPLRTRTHEVSGSFFPMLGVPPLLGRTIGPDDDRAGPASHVVVLSYGFWGRQFGRDPSIVGRSVRLSDEPYTIVGVMPAEFFGIDRASVPDLWVPFAREPNTRFAWVIGRLRPGVTVEGARAALEPVFSRALESLARWFIRSTDQERKGFMAQRLLVNRATEGTSIIRWSYWSYHNTLKILVALTGLVLVIACVNLANLLMARSAGRAREIGIRLAVGAGRWRVARQLMTENLLLSLAGAALGLAAAGWGHRLLLGYLMRDPAGAALDYRLDFRLIGFGLLAAVATSLIFGLLPAIRATRMDLSSAIRAGAGGGALNLPVAKVMLAAQIGLSMVLLVGAALFARSLRNLGSADLGLAREDLLLVDVRPAAGAPEARRQFWNAVTTRVGALPGVRSVALGGDAVFGNGGWRQTVWIERPGQEPQWLNVADNIVSAGFFATTGIPLLAGRELGEQDRDGAPSVIVVNRTFARRAFSDGNPIGRRIGDEGAASAGRYEIVGMAGDAKYGEVREKTLPMVFHPMAQDPRWPRASCVLHVRTAAPQDAAAAIRREILSIDTAALIGEPRTPPQILRAQLREDRMFASLAAFFAGLALALGAIGIYGVMSYRVARRTAEIGVRVALGARRGDVVWLVLREAALLLAIGIALGAPAAVAAARLLKSVLFGLEPLDPPALAVAAILLLAAGGLAGFLPARRAASIEPTVALRAD